jgi:hypothetical protein
MCLLKQWKRPRTRRRNLVALGILEDWARHISGSRKGCWRLANTPQGEQSPWPCLLAQPRAGQLGRPVP